MSDDNQTVDTLREELAAAKRDVARLNMVLSRSMEDQTFYAMLDTFPQPVSILDRAGNILAINRTGVDYGNSTLEEMLGRSIRDLVHDQFDTMLERIRHTVATGESGKYEDKLTDAQGEWWLVSIFQPTRFNDEDAVIVTSYDITQERAALEAEQRQRAFANALIDTGKRINSSLDVYDVLQHIVSAVDDVIPHHGANILLFDPSRTRMRVAQVSGGYADNGLEAPSLNMSWAVADFATVGWIMEHKQALYVRDTATDPRWYQPAGPRIRSYLGAPIIINDEVIGIANLDAMVPDYFDEAHREPLLALANQAAIAIRNARLFQQLQVHTADLEFAVEFRTAELAQANEELRRLSEIKDQFVSNVSHELRSPITSIQMQLSMMEFDPANQPDYLARLRRETDRLKTLIEELLRLSRLDQGHFELELARIDLNPIAENFVADRRPLAESAGLSLDFQPHQPLPTVMANADMLEQVLGILVTNAINYTPAGGAVAVQTAAPNPYRVQVAISDTGPGIDSDEQARIFDRFYRGKSGLASRVGGTGLGLSIAAKIIEYHRGKLGVHSPGFLGAGTTFVVQLPTEDAPTETPT